MVKWIIPVELLIYKQLYIIILQLHVCTLQWCTQQVYVCNTVELLVSGTSISRCFGLIWKSQLLFFHVFHIQSSIIFWSNNKNTYVYQSLYLDVFLIRRFSLQLPCALTYRLPMETPVSYIQREEPGYRCTVNLASNCWALRTSGVAWMVPTSLVYLPVQVKHKNNPISQSLINPFNWEVHGKASDFSWL